MLLHVITVITDERNEYFELLIESARQRGIEVEVLKPVAPAGLTRAAILSQKLKLVHSFLQTVEPTEVVMFVDGYDVVVNGSSSQLLERFRLAVEGRHVALFSAELNCWPDEDLADKYPQGPSPYRFLNSGTYVAEAGVLLRIFNEFSHLIGDLADDQRFFTHIFLNTQGNIILDSRNQIFNCLEKVDAADLQLTANGWYNRVTESFPLVFHGNGHSKPMLYEVICPAIVPPRIV